MSIFGVYGSRNASRIIYYALHALQHRGQEGAGIVTFDSEGNAYRHRGPGLVGEVFNERNLDCLQGDMGIGSVCYDSALKSGADNFQPTYFRHYTGDFSIASDGCLVNADRIRHRLEKGGSLFQGATDSELLAHLIRKTSELRPRIFHLVDALNMMEGSFSFLIMTRNRIYACRDKMGFKPLALGRLGDGWVVSSETCAFDLIGAEFVRDIEPGEIITIDEKGIRSRRYSQIQHHDMCGMEYIYLARPDSDIDGCNVHAFRKESGRRLFMEHPADADIVVGVPDSSLSAAMGYSEQSGIPYEMGLIKSKYVGRTFIQPTQEMRERGVKMKLSAVRSIVSGKRIVLVDDSIVRGTTSLKIIKLLREAGATEVHVRIASPRMTHPCYYGVDTSTFEELLCSKRDTEEACRVIGADSLGFLSPQSTIASCPGRKEMCLACFTGNYPTSIYKNEETTEED